MQSLIPVTSEPCHAVRVTGRAGREDVGSMPDKAGACRRLWEHAETLHAARCWSVQRDPLLPMRNPTRTRLVTRPWMAKLEKTFLENQSLARPGW